MKKIVFSMHSFLEAYNDSQFSPHTSLDCKLNTRAGNYILPIKKLNVEFTVLEKVEGAYCLGLVRPSVQNLR